MDFAVFIPACFALNLTFGPNNLLAMTHGAQQGPGFAVRVALGRLVSFIPMIALVAVGLGLLLAVSAEAFTLLKLIGAAYLIWLGVKVWHSARDMRAGWEAGQDRITYRQGFIREMLTAGSNPKAMLIFVALFPSFVDPGHYLESYVTLGALFLVGELIAVFAYAGLGRLMATAAKQHLPLMQRASGATLVLFGILMMFAKRPETA